MPKSFEWLRKMKRHRGGISFFVFQLCTVLPYTGSSIILLSLLAIRDWPPRVWIN